MSQIEDLETQFRAAQAAAEAYSTEITAKYRQEMPDPADWSGPGPDPDMAYARAKAWSDEERAELARLREEARRIVVELHRAREAAKREGDNY